MRVSEVASEHIEESIFDAEVVSKTSLTPKRLFDISISVVGLACAGLVGMVLLGLNPFFNPGPLLFRQERMGLNGVRFQLIKFRTMKPCASGTKVRSALAPLESNRIGRLGAVLRRYRLDELPNFVNVLRGEMSIIGPRPDAWEHAEHYWDSVPHYKERFQVVPGITGLAQVVGGYADNPNAIKRKARFDRIYVRRKCARMELFILWRTCVICLSGFGAK